MFMKTILVMLACLRLSFVTAQNQLSSDSIPKVLHEVVVRAYEQNRQLKEVAAPIGVVSNLELQQFTPVSILPAVNTIPGVRMEERSPGSYRLSIRGSSLRSPFGVRNVKIYLNDIPFTDPGGNTYLNQLSFYNFSSIEILKGPGSSLYGAGTGGVMLINSFPQNTQNGLSLNYSMGSYQSRNLNASATLGTDAFRNVVSYTHQSSDGYRQQSAMRRDIISWQTRIKASEKESLTTQVLFGDLNYETPGALTRAQYIANPKAARPAGGGFPSAIDNKAAISQKTFWAGIHHEYNFNEHWQNSTSVYGAFSQVRNPAIRNYERRLEPNFGGRTTFSYSTAIKEARLKLVAGAEAQQGYSTIGVYNNKRGNTDSLQTQDEVDNHSLAVFLQGDLVLPKGWIITAGVSLNESTVNFQRLSVVPAFNYKTRFNNELAPRVSLLKKLNNDLSVYGLVSKGFSPPTVAELLPSTTVINTDLQAEKGYNYELGFRGTAFRNRLAFDVNAYYFSLQNSITQRRDVSGADYFVNAGNTKQQGIETALDYIIIRNTEQFVTRLNVFFNHSYQYYRYKEFKQLNAELSGNRIPGIAPHTVSTGVNFETKPGWYANVNYFYSDRIALNDANAEYASSYNLLGFKAGFKRSFGTHVRLDIFATGDNLFDQQYSLGNDINAAGNRFYNAAPGRNWSVGVGLGLL
jgi:iron complex outermembrane receptor protein